jgi:serine/threonine-protein kinase HipA
MRLTLQIHDSLLGWLDAGSLVFHDKNDVSVEYDLDYVCNHLQKNGSYAFSIRFPVDFAPYRGPIPGYLVDWVPQGQILKRLLGRYGITHDDDFGAILSRAPLASPGNLRVKEPWELIEKNRPSYRHPGFTKDEIIAAKENFVEYMETHGAPVGGTSGAGGGAPKFLLREDYKGRFHADGYLDDTKTKQAYLIKFPFTDSNNSRLLAKTEKAYHDFLRGLPVFTVGNYEIYDDILFIPRFDRIREKDGRLHYHGLESLYSAHGINTHGQMLSHEANLTLIRYHATHWQNDIVEYLVRDIINQALSNTDNHGRNTSLIKIGSSVTLSPIYDVTAMRFFRGDFIIPLTNWDPPHQEMLARIDWIIKYLHVPSDMIKDHLRTLRDSYLVNLEDSLRKHHVPDTIIAESKDDRETILTQLAHL